MLVTCIPRANAALQTAEPIHVIDSFCRSVYACAVHGNACLVVTQRTYKSIATNYQDFTSEGLHENCLSWQQNQVTVEGKLVGNMRYDALTLL